MSLIKRRIITVLMANLLILVSANGQLVYEMKFVGKLIDSQSKPICNEDFDLTVQISKEGVHEILYEVKPSAFSDEEGWFTYTISDISQFLLEDGELKHPLVIKMEILPNARTKWMSEGKDFMVTYTLKPDRDSIDTQLMMTRLEGSTLVKHAEDHLFAFKDQDPFSYLLGGFLITDQPPISDLSVSDLKQWLSPETRDEDGGVSRGVKGGFPAGGYHRKK